MNYSPIKSIAFFIKVLFFHCKNYLDKIKNTVLFPGPVPLAKYIKMDFSPYCNKLFNSLVLVCFFIVFFPRGSMKMKLS